MSIKIHNNYNRKDSSLLRRAWKFIRETLTFRLQWMHLRKRGETPNYLYLKSRVRDRETLEKDSSDVSIIKISTLETSIEAAPVSNLEGLFEQSNILVEKFDLKEPAVTEQFYASDDAGHGTEEDSLIIKSPVVQEKIEKSLQILVNTDDKRQPSSETVLPIKNNVSEDIKVEAIETLQNCTEQFPEGAETDTLEPESTSKEMVAETARNSKKSGKIRGARGNKKDRRNQMPLPFE